MISIIFGTFNRLLRLKNSIASINRAAQLLPSPPEIIVIDGGSTDGTLGYLSGLPNVTLIAEGGLHGVTRAYNRGFRMASRPYITWFSDDFTYQPNALLVLLNRLKRENNMTLLAPTIGVGGKFRNYAPNTPIGIGHRTLFQRVNYWSDEFITYASDNDFSLRITMAGGRVVGEPGAKVIHHIDMKDHLHRENLSNNRCSQRYVDLYRKGIRGWRRTYPEIWIKAESAAELIKKIENARLSSGWCNFFTGRDFGMGDLLASMNVTIEQFKGRRYYAKVL